MIAKRRRKAGDGAYPASLAQRRIWEHCQGPNGPAGYILATARPVSGPIDLVALRASLDHIARRHEMLRTTFEEHDGELVQIVHEAAPLELAFVDLGGAADPAAAAQRRLRAAALEPFALERGPLVRFSLVRLSEREHELQQVSHHIISDAASWSLLIEELAAIYPALLRGDAPPLPGKLAPQPRDIAARERRELRPGNPRFERSLAWWRKLAEAGESNPLPFLRPERDAGAGLRDGVIAWGLDAELVAGLEGLARRLGVSYFRLGLATFTALLASESGEAEILVGTMIGRRDRETRALFGCFSHLMTLRLALDPRLRFAEWAKLVATAVDEAKRHSALPFEEAATWLAREGRTLPSIRAVFQLRLPHSVRFDDIEIGSPRRSSDHYMQTGFELVVDRRVSANDCAVLFDPRIYDPALVRAFVERYRALLGSICADADRSIGALTTGNAGEASKR